MTKKYEYICSECGQACISAKRKSILICERCLKKTRDDKKNEETKSPYRKSNHGNQALYEDNRRFRQYNIEHNTNLSYGQIRAIETHEAEKIRKPKTQKNKSRC